MTYEHLKHRFLDLTQVTFWSGQEVENEFEVPGKNLNYRLPDLNNVAFSAGQEAENEFKMPWEHLNIVLSTS